MTAAIDRGSEGEGEDGRTTLIDRGKEVGGGGGGEELPSNLVQVPKASPSAYLSYLLTHLLLH